MKMEVIGENLKVRVKKTTVRTYIICTLLRVISSIKEWAGHVAWIREMEA